MTARARTMTATGIISRFKDRPVRRPVGDVHRLMQDRGDGGPRMCYDRGTLEILSPLRKHEWLKSLLGRFVEILTLESGIPISSAGSTTLRSQLKERGIEPDESYYIQNEPAIRLKDDFDIQIDPPPDLAIEIDITSSSIDKLGVYAAFGVSEVWTWDDGVKIFVLGSGGRYSEAAQSRALPRLTSQVLSRFLARRSALGEAALVLELRDWVRKGLPEAR